MGGCAHMPHSPLADLVCLLQVLLRGPQYAIHHLPLEVGELARVAPHQPVHRQRHLIHHDGVAGQCRLQGHGHTTHME